MNSPTAWKYINKGLFAILAVLVLATIASIIFLSNTLFKLDSLIGKSGQSISMTLALQDLFINLADAETSSRGYVITGEAQYVKSYDQATRDIPKNLANLQSNQQTKLSNAQKTRLKTLTQERLALLKRTVDARTVGDTDTAQAILADGQGSRLMDLIRTDVETISTASVDDIGLRQLESGVYLSRALSVAGVVSLFVLSICLVLIWYFQHTVHRERVLEGTKNEFLSLASHQLRTPATNVKQYVGLILDGYLGDVTAKQRDALKVAYKNNESEIRIINDLLDVAKIDLQRIQLHKRRINVVTVVKHVVKEYDQHIDKHGQTLTLKAPPELMAMVDRDYFQGVIEKLIDNAVKYSYDKTGITVRVRADEAKNRFEVVVKDRGLGIQKREVPKLFIKFSRLTNEFSAHTEGSGLGLYWVKQIMALHGGSVKVVSQEGRGSKFTVRAPIA